MADKLTQQLTEGLAKAAAHPGGLPLLAAKTDPGLFPNTAAAKPAAQKCVADGLVRVAGTDTKGKATRELYALTEAGWEFLLAQVNPKQVLEDFNKALPRHPLIVEETAELKAGKKLPLMIETPQAGAAEVLYGLGAALGRRGGEDLGLIYLQLALYLVPSHPLALLSLGDLYEATPLDPFSGGAASR